jgi:hypothetical protein
LFFLAGADFLGAAQLMVYVGGTMVLLVFGVMLTARGPFVSMKLGSGQWIVAIIAGGGWLASGRLERARRAGPVTRRSKRCGGRAKLPEKGKRLMGCTDRLADQNNPAGGMSGYLAFGSFGPSWSCCRGSLL